MESVQTAERRVSLR